MLAAALRRGTAVSGGEAAAIVPCHDHGVESTTSTAISTALIAYEVIRFREARARIRGAGLPESMMAR
jgi:hypothetical protein